MPENLQLRANHFFSEIQRVIESIAAWKEGDLEKFGSLINASGRSSIINYQCGCPELITLYEILHQSPGVIGTRFSGGGFRGCCIALIDPAYRPELQTTVTQQYLEKYPARQPNFGIYFCHSGTGATVL